MPTKMLIDARHPEETRVAVVTNNRVEEFDFEAAARKQIKGNIYLAKITRVEPSLQAAFVDYGGNRHGFLAFSEIHPDYYQIPKEDREQLLREEQELAEEQQAMADREDQNGDSNGDASGETDAENGADLPESPEEHGGDGDDIIPAEVSPEDLRRRRMALRRRYKIQEVIRRRQVMLVQVVKEERGNKGAALTTYISLAGRYSVLMPNTAHGGGISRKITNAADRRRLKGVMDEINLPAAMGAIIRTAGVERTKAEIRRDFTYLSRLWDEIRDKTLASTAPALIYEDSALIKRAIRDIYSRDVKEVIVDGKDGHQEARSFMRLLMPSHVRRVQLYEDALPLFQQAGIETQLSALIDPVVTLKSGGYIVINSTEALVAVDVNSGRANREHSIEETALKTNTEAAEEVARQLRLRDLAGLIVVDFIDMESHSNNRRVERALKDALKHDRARIQVGRISSFGLLEMSRQRMRTGVLEATTQPCPTCDGSGIVRTESSASLAALRTLEEEAAKGRNSHFRLRTDQTSAIYILNQKREELVDLEERYGVTIEIAPDNSMAGGLVAIDSGGPATGKTAADSGQKPARSERPSRDDQKSARQDDREKREKEETEEAGAAEADSDHERSDQEREGSRRPRRRGGRGRNGRSAQTTDSNDTEQKESSSDKEQRADRQADRQKDDDEQSKGSRRRHRPRRRSTRDREDQQEQPSSDSSVHDESDAADDTRVAAQSADADTAVSESADAKEAGNSKGRVTEEKEASEKAAPRRRTSARRKKAEDQDGGDSPAATDTSDKADAEKPRSATRRRPSSRRSSADTKQEQQKQPEDTPEATANRKEGDTAASKQDESKAQPGPAAEKPAEPATADSAPSHGPAANTDSGDSGETSTPRRGWWQRTFGN